MATLKVRIENLATRAATEDKSIRTLLNGNLANLTALTTAVKTNLVAAINELVTSIAGKQASLGFTPENIANKGIANGYASLDGTGKVPAAQLPASLDDVLEYANLAAFPGAGTSGIIYVAIDTGIIYRWTGTVYMNISQAAGAGTTDNVAEGATNLYFTNARAIAALDVGLGVYDSDYVATFNAALV